MADLCKIKTKVFLLDEMRHETGTEKSMLRQGIMSGQRAWYPWSNVGGSGVFREPWSQPDGEGLMGFLV